MAECLRSELAGSGIHVSVVCPVSTASEFKDVMIRETGSDVSRSLGPVQSAEDVAEAIARAIAHPTAEVHPYFPSRGLVLLNALAPGLTDRFVQRFGRKPARRAG
jgi:short-subunit dehydrogenase